ncbi:hypothetical protein EJB05_54418, partial [Eragrostis curvula]
MTKKKTFGEAGADGKGKKKTMGRQKIEMKPIESMEKRQVCFSKRRAGLFKKASDLSVLCGAHVAVVAYSPGGKPFVFGHPSAQALIDRFTDASSSEPATAAAAAAPVHPALLEEFSRDADLLAKAIDAEASRKKALDAATRQAGVWTGDADVSRSLPELLDMRGELERVQAEVAERAQEFMAKEAMMMQSTTTGTDVVSSGGGVFHYPGAGTFMADGGVHHDQLMMMTGGNVVGQALPFAPMMLPPPPTMPYPPAYNHCFDLNNEHCPVFGAEGFYGATTCNFF